MTLCNAAQMAKEAMPVREKAGRGTLLETGMEIEKPESVLLTLLITVTGARIQTGGLGIR